MTDKGNGIMGFLGKAVRNNVVFASMGAIFMLSMLPASAQVIADSVADFSNVQGQNNWFYGYYTATGDSNGYQVNDFSLMTQYNPNTPWFHGTFDTWFAQNGTYWTSLYARGGHGNAVITSGNRARVDQWAIRRYVVGQSGQLNISGNIGKFSTVPASDGITAFIFMNGTNIYSQSVGGQDGVGYNYNLDLFAYAGTTLDFAIAPNNNDFSDESRFTIRISSVAPEPCTATYLVLTTITVIAWRGLKKRLSYS